MVSSHSTRVSKKILPKNFLLQSYRDAYTKIAPVANRFQWRGLPGKPCSLLKNYMYFILFCQTYVLFFLSYILTITASFDRKKFVQNSCLFLVLLIIFLGCVRIQGIFRILIYIAWCNLHPGKVISKKAVLLSKFFANRNRPLFS